MKTQVAFRAAPVAAVAWSAGAAAHLTTELVKQTAGIDMVHVPYKGTAPALQDLMGGKFLADQIAKWAKVIQVVGVKAKQ